MNSDEIPRQVNVFGVLVELHFTQNKFGILSFNQNNNLYLINCLVEDLPFNGSIIFIASIYIAIIPFKNHVYLLNSQGDEGNKLNKNISLISLELILSFWLCISSDIESNSFP